MTQQKPPPKRQRTKFTPAMKARICREVSLGKSLRKVLKQKGMPSLSRTMAVLQEDKAWQEQYAHARRAGIELHIDGMIDLADEATEDNANAIKVRVDTRKWVASKLIPKIYGDKIAAEVTLPDAPPLDRETHLLETARRVAFILHSASNVAAARARMLPAPVPAPAEQGAEGAATYENTAQGGESMKPSTQPDATAAAQETERIFEHEVDRDVRQKQSAPMRIASGRTRKRWDRG